MRCKFQRMAIKFATHGDKAFNAQPQNLQGEAAKIPAHAHETYGTKRQRRKVFPSRRHCLYHIFCLFTNPTPLHHHSRRRWHHQWAIGDR